MQKLPEPLRQWQATEQLTSHQRLRPWPTAAVKHGETKSQRKQTHLCERRQRQTTRSCTQLCALKKRGKTRHTKEGRTRRLVARLTLMRKHAAHEQQPRQAGQVHLH